MDITLTSVNNILLISNILLNNNINCEIHKRYNEYILESDIDLTAISNNDGSMVLSFNNKLLHFNRIEDAINRTNKYIEDAKAWHLQEYYQSVY